MHRNPIYFLLLISFFHLSLWKWSRFRSSLQPFSIQFFTLHPLDHLLCMPFESSLLPHAKHLPCFSLYRFLPTYSSSLLWVALTSFALVTSPPLSTSRSQLMLLLYVLVSALPEFSFIPFTRSFLSLSQPGSSWLSLLLIYCIYLCLIYLPSILTWYSLPVSFLLLAPVYYPHGAPVEPASPLLRQSCCTFSELLLGLLLIQPVP